MNIDSGTVTFVGTVDDAGKYSCRIYENTAVGTIPPLASAHIA